MNTKRIFPGVCFALILLFGLTPPPSFAATENQSKDDEVIQCEINKIIVIFPEARLNTVSKNKSNNPFVNFWRNLAGSLGFKDQVWAHSANAETQLFVRVPSFMKINADMEQITLKFDEVTEGAETNTVIINYMIDANDISKWKDVIGIRLASEIPEVDVQADVVRYHKEGGDVQLVKSQQDFISVSTTSMSIADARIEENPGKVARGTLSIAFKATAKKKINVQEIKPHVITTFSPAL